ncbi:MAG: DUF1343 domain-containing protein [Bacteroidales bacterium]|nr:DUF1343 domain-containing protein [Bacteroidales bacterium]MCI2122160.1 DUF1343 domain-containing protein [Bacteroidales bacterium]MCI2144680.1 DUF1343 domain-containing protein [Bacteroidales bacterium]
MFSFRTTPLMEQGDVVLHKGRVGLLCNQVAWHPEYGEYLFETLARRGNLKRIFLPEHGFFGEMHFQPDIADIDTVMLPATRKSLEDIDALVIELQDAGARYYTITSTLLNLFKTLKRESLDISVYIIDRLNPAGRQVEGTMLEKEYSSSIGMEGLPHRHGLTIGELASLFYSETGSKFPLHVISAETLKKSLMPWSIPPSRDISGLFTCYFYSGQCLWEGTNVSYGRGTTRPFEQFGAPYMKDFVSDSAKHGIAAKGGPLSYPGTFMRWECFTPQYGRYEGQVCYGFQLIPDPEQPYHALCHALRCIRYISGNCQEFQEDRSREGILIGDSILLDYVHGNCEWDDARDHIKAEEQKWIRKAKKYSLYGEQPYRIKAE